MRLGLAKPIYIVAILLGALLGVGFFTFGYGKGISYFSTNPASCANCHIMRDQYDSWQKGTHHARRSTTAGDIPRGRRLESSPRYF